MLPSNSQRDEARNSIIALLSSLRTPSLRDESWVPRLLQSIQMYLYHDPCFQEDQPRNSLLSALLTIHTKPNLLSTSERETLYFRIGPLWDNLVEWVGENPAEYGHFIPMLQSLNLLPACIPPRPTPSSPLDNSTVASSSPPSSQAPISSLAPSRAISMAPDSSSAPDDHRAVSPHQRRTVRFESLSVSSPPSSPMQAQSHFPEVGVLYGVEVGMEGAENDGSQSSDTVQTREEKQVDGAELPGDKEGNSDSFASEKSEAAVDAKDTEMDAVTSLEGESGKADAVYEKNGGSDAMEVDGASHNSSDEEQADPPTKKRKLLGRQATATEDKLFTGKDRCARCRERDMDVCRVAFKDDKSMVCIVCRDDRKRCSKSNRTKAPAKGAKGAPKAARAPSHPSAQTAEPPHHEDTPATDAEVVAVKTETQPLLPTRVSASPQQSTPVQVKTETYAFAPSTNDAARMMSRLFEFKMQRERFKVRVETERNAVAQSQARFSREEAAVAEAQASLASLRAEIASETISLKAAHAKAIAMGAKRRRNGKGAARRRQ